MESQYLHSNFGSLVLGDTQQASYLLFLYFGFLIQIIGSHQREFCSEDTWQYPETFLVLETAGGEDAAGIQWVEARDAAKSAVHRTAP